MKTLLALLIVARASGHDNRDEDIFDSLRLSEPQGLADLPLPRDFSDRHLHETTTDEVPARRLRTDYINACTTPEILYTGTGASGTCVCDEKFASVDRVLCLVDGIDCRSNGSVCTEEQDIWIFDKRSGNLASRSTCVVCADDPESCHVYEDTCFNAGT
jgi:hypothetical protein